MLENLLIILSVYSIICYLLVYSVLSYRLRNKKDWRDWMIFSLSPITAPLSIIVAIMIRRKERNEEPSNRNNLW